MININEKMKELANYKMIAAETAAIIEGLQDEIKSYMTANGLTELIGDEHKATYKVVKGTRLDSKALKNELPDVAERFTINTETARFTFN